MKNHIADISLRQAALAAGFGLLLMLIPGPFANFFVLDSLIVPGDATTTTANILANQSLFRLGVNSLIFVIILDVVVAWALYVFLKPVNRSISLLAAWFRLVFLTIFGIALVNLLSALLLVSGTDFLRVFEPDHLGAQVMQYLSAFRYGENIAYVFFGLHLLIVGYLVFKLDYSGFIPKILGILLIIAGLGYFIDSFGKLLSPSYDMNLAFFTFIGEVLFMLWLLFKGGKDQPRDNLAPTSP